MQFEHQWSSQKNGTEGGDGTPVTKGLLFWGGLLLLRRVMLAELRIANLLIFSIERTQSLRKL